MTDRCLRCDGEMSIPVKWEGMFAVQTCSCCNLAYHYSAEGKIEAVSCCKEWHAELRNSVVTPPEGTLLVVGDKRLSRFGDTVTDTTHERAWQKIQSEEDYKIFRAIWAVGIPEGCLGLDPPTSR